jgi:hypothetical protein
MININHQKIIIKALAGATSASPMTATELHKIAGGKIQNLDVFDEICEQLYQARIINRCLHTKNGLEQYLYWPTANVNNKAPVFIISNKRHLDATLTPPPRRTESYKPIVTTNKDESTMSKSPKYPATLIVQAVADNPKIHFNALIAKLIGESKNDHNQVRDMLYYCIKSRFVNKDDHKQLTLGDNDAWLLKNGFTEDKLKPASSKDKLTVEVEATEALAVVREAIVEAKKELRVTHVSEITPIKASTFNPGVAYSTEKIFELLPANCTLQIRKTDLGELLLQLNINDDQYHPKLNLVDECIKAIKTLNMIKAA